MSEIATVICCATCFVCGYVLGRIETIISILKGTTITTSHVANMPSFLDTVKSSTNKSKKSIQIDDSKFVTSVSIDDLSSVEDQSLGTVVKTEDNISSAASKLAQLKKARG